jgi:hypothetical protein
VSILHRALAILVAAGMLVALARLTRVPWRVETTPRSVLRLSWRALGERIERCRPATADELAGVPAHMRQEVVCEDPKVAPYQLSVAVDGRELFAGLAEGSGVPGDRPMYVLREFDIAPGDHRVEVRFEREGAAPTSQRDARNEPEREHEREVQRRAIPPVLHLDTTVTVPASAVLLVTHSSESRKLVLYSPSGTGGR